MNKQNNLQEELRPESKQELVENFKTELIKSSDKELEFILKKLNYLCLELDPYNADVLKVEEENILAEFMLDDYLGNPFEFTNIVLQMLDFVENETKKRLH